MNLTPNNRNELVAYIAYKFIKEASAEVEELLKKESNKLLKTVVEDVEKNVAPEFPNCRKKITFLRGIIVYGQLYDTIAAAAKKSSKEEGYLAPEVANELIESLRKVVKRYLDVELKAVYTTFENVENDSITENEILDTIKNLKGENTIIIVSHKDSVLVSCDRTFELKNNEIFQIK